VPTNPLPVTGRQAGVDVGIVSFATTSDGSHIDNPRWGRAAADKLATAQQRLTRANRRSKNRDRKRETVAARHRKIANQRKDFHHKQACALVAEYDLLVVGPADRQHAAAGQTRARPRQTRSIPAQRGSRQDRTQPKY
jgi:putative transposase